ncbi:MAG: pitrilysin family protein [Legionellaceae bacterium]|nr:pitrilysin family protein [Legionellaceae bacterium]
MKISRVLQYVFLGCGLLSLASYGAQTRTLPNGLKIVVEEDHRAPIAVVMVWYHVGSADEPGGLTGISHMLEHYMFQGTPQHPAGEFSRIISAKGGQENAFTSYDYTAFFEKIAQQSLSEVLALEADRMQHLIWNPTSFAKELKVVREERRLRTDDNPQDTAFERFMATAHLTPPYQHPVIGWMEDLDNLHLQDAHNWYQHYYAPNNATLVVVGDVSAPAVFKIASRHFGALHSQSDFSRRRQPEPVPLGPKSVIIQIPAKMPAIILGYPVPSRVTSDSAWEPYALELLAGIFDAGESGRLSQHLIKNKAIASNVNTDYNMYSRYPTLFTFTATPSKEKTLAVLKQNILQEIEKIQKKPVSVTELDRVKHQIIAQKTFEKDSIFYRAMEIGILETIGLGYQVQDQYIANINAITPAQIQSVAQKYLHPNVLTEAQLLPQTTLAQESS